MEDRAQQPRTWVVVLVSAGVILAAGVVGLSLSGENLGAVVPGIVERLECGPGTTERDGVCVPLTPPPPQTYFTVEDCQGTTDASPSIDARRVALMYYNQQIECAATGRCGPGRVRLVERGVRVEIVQGAFPNPEWSQVRFLSGNLVDQVLYVPQTCIAPRSDAAAASGAAMTEGKKARLCAAAQHGWGATTRAHVLSETIVEGQPAAVLNQPALEALGLREERDVREQTGAAVLYLLCAHPEADAVYVSIDNDGDGAADGAATRTARSDPRLNNIFTR